MQAQPEHLGDTRTLPQQVKTKPNYEVRLLHIGVCGNVGQRFQP